MCVTQIAFKHSIRFLNLQIVYHLHNVLHSNPCSILHYSLHGICHYVTYSVLCIAGYVIFWILISCIASHVLFCITVYIVFWITDYWVFCILSKNNIYIYIYLWGIDCTTFLRLLCTINTHISDIKWNEHFK